MARFEYRFPPGREVTDALSASTPRTRLNRYRPLLMNVLVIVSGGLGETLQAAPLLRNLRAGLPEAHIALAAPQQAAELDGHLPAVDEIICFVGLEVRAPARGMVRTWTRLRRQRFDIAILCSRRRRDSLLAYTLGIPRRLGVAHQPAGILMSHRLKQVPTLNNAAAWLELASLLGLGTASQKRDFIPSDVARQRIDQMLVGAHVDPQHILVAIAPGMAGTDTPAVDPQRILWPPEHYAHLANQMALRHGASIVLLGPESDQAPVNAVKTDLGAPHLDLCGELNFDETAALLARCDLLVGGDSPLLHLAAAVGTAAIGLFGPTDGGSHGPYGSAHRVLQALPRRGSSRNQPSGSIDQIRVEDVLAGIEASL